MLGEVTASRCASALEKPNRSAAATAPPGFHLPTMTTARPMKPLPTVMFWLNECTKPIERNTPPSAANAPEAMTAQ
jgi:hypothetical protein